MYLVVLLIFIEVFQLWEYMLDACGATLCGLTAV